MLQIQKQNIFLRGEIISGAGADLTPKISGTPEQQAVMKESREQRNALASETLEKGQKNEMVKRAQAMLQKLGFYTKGLDGDYGNGTEAAVKSFQSANGLNPDGKIGVNTALALVRAFQTKVGLNPDGIVGPNTLAALGGGVDTAPQNTRTRTNRAETVNVVEKNAVEKFFGVGQRDALRAQIERYIGAGSTPELKALGNEAGIAKDGSNAEVNRVYTKIMKVLPKYVNDKRVLNAFNIGFWEGITEKRFAQSQVLDFFENALMGSAISEKVATGEVGAEKYLMHSDSVVNKSIAVMNGYDFAATAKSNMIGLRKYAKGKVASTAFGEGVYFSTRTQDGQSRLGKFTRAQEVAVLGGNVAWEINESKADINRFIDAMTVDQLKVIDKKLTQVNRLTKEKLKKLVASGQVKLNASMYIAENCSNLSFMITVTDNMPKRENDNSGNDGSGRDTGPSSTPGERGGGDEGGGGTDGGQGGDRG